MPRLLPVLVALVVVLLAGCTSGSSEKTQPPSSAAPSAPLARTYVSVGDSYAAGYQPAAGGGYGSTTRNGFAYQAVDLAAARGYDLTLVNFACSGATTTSALKSPGCERRRLGPGAPSYDVPQVSAAEQYLRAHRGSVGLVSVSLGGNDIRPCVDSASVGAATSCVSDRLSQITTNLRTITERLRSAAGPGVKIVGAGYPDVFLGEALSDSAERRQLADLSVFAFRSLVNPQVSQAYEAAAATFVDVTDAFGAYVPESKTTTLAPYGRIPVRVAQICRLTYYCQLGDIHPRAAGHKIIAQLVVRALPRR